MTDIWIYAMLLAAPPAGADRELLAAAVQGNIVQISRLLAKDANVNARDSNGQTPVQLAAARGHADAVKILVKHGGDVNASDKTGATALMLGAMGGHSNILSHKMACRGSVRFVGYSEVGTKPASAKIVPRLPAQLGFADHQVFPEPPPQLPS